MTNQRPFALRSLRFAALLFALTALPFAAHAQTATATLSGTVEDEKGAVVPGVTVAVLNVDTSFRRESTTNDSGSFLFTLLPPGHYSLTAERQGFKVMQVPSIVLNVGDQKALQIKLEAGNISETVRIEGEAPLINESPAVATTVDRQFVGNIPLNGRSLQSLIALTPGVSQTPAANNSPGQFSVNGQRSNANYFLVDGVSANVGLDPNSGIPGQQYAGAVPGLTSSGSTSSLVSVDALQEFKIQTSGYAPEFGRQPGGQVSLITRSGTNDFHGSLFEYFRNEALDANDWFSNRARLPRAPLRQNLFGGTFSGPVYLPRFGQGGPALWSGRNRTFFFFSYEGLRLRLPQTAVRTVPSLRIRQAAAAALRPILNGFPLPTGPEIVGSSGQPNGTAPLSATYSNPQTLDATSIRIDHTIDKHSLFGRFNYAPSNGAARSLQNLSQITATNNVLKSLTLGATYAVSAHLINELRINYSDNRARLLNTNDAFGGAVPVDPSLLIPAGVSPDSSRVQVLYSLGGQTNLLTTGDSVDSRQQQINVIENLSVDYHAHQLKFGIDYRRLAPVDGRVPYGLTYTFSTEAQLINGVAANASIRGRVGFKPIINNFSAFLQDNWKLARRLTLTYGLRWELNPPPGEADGKKPLVVVGLDNPSTATLGPSNAPLYKARYDNFAPRIGFAYQLSQKQRRETMLRGGFGVFYDLGSGPSLDGFNGLPFTSQRLILNVQFPISPSLATIPPPSSITFPIAELSVVDGKLKLPYTLQWNLGIEQSLGANQTVSVFYVAAAGRRLLMTRAIRNPNPNFGRFLVTTNGGTSDYHSLQVQFQRRLSRGLQVLSSYTWSHAIDEVSDELFSFNVSRGNASFDVRHIFSGAATWNLPAPSLGKFGNAVLRNWAVDAIIRAQSATLLTITGQTITDEFGREVGTRPKVIPGVPVYVNDPIAPGGRRLNNAVPTAAQIAAAGCAPLGATTPAKGAFCTPLAGQQGNLGRNVLRGLPVHQLDFALRRQFNLKERWNLQFSAEAFNVFNHPNFGPLNPSLNSASFGEPTAMLGRSLGGLNALHQIGGPRSIQFALRMQF